MTERVWEWLEKWESVRSVYGFMGYRVIVYEVCFEVLSRVFSSLRTPVQLKNANIVAREKRKKQVTD